MILGTRVVIVGNSGSGRSSLARVIARRSGAPMFDLDDCHWRERDCSMLAASVEALRLRRASR